jgi:hypothetical protein
LAQQLSKKTRIEKIDAGDVALSETRR